MPSGQEQAVDTVTGGKKGLSPDRYDLIPAKALEYLALIYGKSAKEHGGKYDARNWEKGYPWGWSIRALFKHAWSVVRGEWLDPESGLPHIMHAAWHCFTLCTFHDYNIGTDDRSKLIPPLAEMEIGRFEEFRWIGPKPGTPLVFDRIPRIPDPSPREPFLVEMRGKIVAMPNPLDVVERMENKQNKRVPCTAAQQAGEPWLAGCLACNPRREQKGSQG